MIIECSCKNEFQDREHGRRMRVRNAKKKRTGARQSWRCTVCGKVKEMGARDAE